jgi:hypothetical protein
VLSYIGRSLFDGLITSLKDSYQMSKYIKNFPVCEAAKVFTRTVEPQMNEMKDEVT